MTRASCMVYHKFCEEETSIPRRGSKLSALPDLLIPAMVNFGVGVIFVSRGELDYSFSPTLEDTALHELCLQLLHKK